MIREYWCDGSKTLSQICTEYNLSITDILVENTQQINFIDFSEDDYKKYYETYKTRTTRDLLSKLASSNSKLIKGLMINFRIVNTGGITESDPQYYRYVQNKLANPISSTQGDIPGIDLSGLASTRVYAYHAQGSNGIDTTSYLIRDKSYLANGQHSGGHPPVLPVLVTTKRSYQDLNCYFTIYKAGSAVTSMYLPMYPEEVSDSNTGEFTSQTLFGRSVSYQVYNSSSRSVSFNLILHEEIVPNDYDYVHKVVSTIKSACYPGYSTQVVEPPEIKFCIGKHFQVRGILTDCGATWKAPIIDDKLTNCDLSIGVLETTGPYSMDQVASMKGWRT